MKTFSKMHLLIVTMLGIVFLLTGLVVNRIIELRSEHQAALEKIKKQEVSEKLQNRIEWFQDAGCIVRLEKTPPLKKKGDKILVQVGNKKIAVDPFNFSVVCPDGGIYFF